MNIAPILHLLREHAGLDAASLGMTTVRAIVAARLRACGERDVAGYAARLGRDAREFAALLGEVVVPETWFFRGGRLFAHLAEHIRSAGKLCRVLSLPCSTGEEPYSLAMALFDVGTNATITGVDISERSLELARQGVFTELSFRQMDPATRGQHFRAVAGGWQIAEAFRQQVQFRTGNILDPALLVLEPSFDVVFCRNLFIYLTPQARTQALATLARLVTPGGLLCMGHAEIIDADAHFRREGPEGFFLYRRSPIAQLPSQPDAPARVSVTARRASEGQPEPLLARRAVTAPRTPDLLEVFAVARQQADAGQLAAALESCRDIERRFGPSADLCSLIGVIEQARQNLSAATTAFRKALYLAPDHRDALLHLMLLCLQQGDHTQAALLRKRLDRLSPPGVD